MKTDTVVKVVLVTFILVGILLAAAVIYEGNVKTDTERPTELSDGSGPQTPESDTGVRETGGSLSSPSSQRHLNTTFDYEIAEPAERWFEDTAGESGLEYQQKITGSFMMSNPGVYVNDFNNDGTPDILATGGEEPALFETTPSGMVESDSLKSPRISSPVALFFDYDNDGWDDLLLAPSYETQKETAEPVFFENRRGEFVETNVGLNVELNNTVTGMSAADYTGNGCLDLFIIQEGDWRTSRPVGMNQVDVTTEEDNGNPNRLFAGDCRGFEEMTGEAGIRGRSWSLAASFVDLTNDGYPDIHVANDFNNDVVYINEGDGTFDRRVLPDSTNRNGMSSEVADVNGDGYLDIFVTNIHSVIAGENSHLSISGYRVGGRITGNNLLINQGNGTFVDRAEEYGVQVGGWGWGAEFADFDNDMRQELVHGTFFGIPSMGATSVLWDRNGSGYEYVNSSAAGLETSRSWGIATADFDSDGMLDLVESNLEGNVSLYENRLDLGNWIEVAVDGGNRTEIGTRVYVEAKDREQMRVVSSRSGYMSQSSSILHFGLDNATRVDIHVEWPDGETEIYSDVEANQRVYIRNNRSNVGSFTKST